MENKKMPGIMSARTFLPDQPVFYTSTSQTPNTVQATIKSHQSGLYEIHLEEACKVFDALSGEYLEKEIGDPIYARHHQLQLMEKFIILYNCEDNLSLKRELEAFANEHGWSLTIK